MFKKPVYIFIVVGVLLLGWYLKHTSSIVSPLKNGSAPSSSNSPNSMNSTGVGSNPANLPPKYTLAEARDLLKKIKDLAIDMSNSAKRSGKKGQDRQYRNEYHALRRDLRPMLVSSEEARKYLLEMIDAEKDPSVKRELAKLLNSLEPSIREPLQTELAKSSSEDSRVTGLRGLSTLGTETSLKTMIDRAHNDTSMEVRKEAIDSMGRSVSYADPKSTDYVPTTRTTIQNFTSPANDPTLREAAYRAYTYQSSFAASDIQFLQNAAKNEKDPRVQRMALFAIKVAQASSQARTTTSNRGASFQ